MDIIHNTGINAKISVILTRGEVAGIDRRVHNAKLNLTRVAEHVLYQHLQLLYGNRIVKPVAV